MGPRPGILARAWRNLEPGDARDCACDADRHETAFRNVAASLAKIARRSQQAA
jgi:hypothetical protein